MMNSFAISCGQMAWWIPFGYNLCSFFKKAKFCMSEQTSVGASAVPSKWKLPVPTMWEKKKTALNSLPEDTCFITHGFISAAVWNTWKGKRLLMRGPDQLPKNKCYVLPYAKGDRLLLPTGYLCKVANINTWKLKYIAQIYPTMPLC